MTVRRQRNRMRTSVGRYVFLPNARVWGTVVNVSDAEQAGANVCIGAEEVRRLQEEEKQKFRFFGSIKLVYVDSVFAYPCDVCFSCRTDAACPSHRKLWDEAAQLTVRDVHGD